MSDLKTLLDGEARGFGLGADAWDRTQGSVVRRRRRRRISASVVALVVAVGGMTGAWVAFGPGPRGTAPGAGSNPDAGGGTTQSPAAQGPLIGQIVMTTGDGVPQLMVIDPDGSGGHVLNPSPYPQWDPAVSPDGTRIAYRGYFGPQEGDYDLFVMNADGSGVTRLTHDVLAAAPAWSPDGSRIAFGASGVGGVPGQAVGRALIEVIDADGTGMHALTDPPPGAEDSSPSWSPDSTRVAFVRLTQEDGFQIYTANVDGTDTAQVTATPGFKSHPAWSPDGRTIAFAGTPQGEPSQIYTVDAGGGTPTPLTDGSGSETSPLWVDGGTRIAFIHQEGSELRTTNPDGTGVTRVDGVHSVAAFDWRTEP
jgi:WD40-like Beta Propeller Repeat